MKIVKFLLSLLVILICLNSFGQIGVKRANNFSNYKDPSNEIGYSIDVVYLNNENRIAPQFHLHYTRQITYFFSLGLSYSSIYDPHFHNSFDFEVGIRYYPEIYFAIKPGVQIVQKDNETIMLLDFGIEAAYEIKIGERAHVGPMVGLNFSPSETLYSYGYAILDVLGHFFKRQVYWYTNRF
jgi:hypothetical protein